MEVIRSRSRKIEARRPVRLSEVVGKLTAVTTAPTPPPLPSVIKFLVGSRETGKWSYAWRFWSRSTSFYVQSLAPELRGIKVSVHGPDPRPGLEPCYHVKLDRSVQESGGVLTRRIGDWPDRQIFLGHQVHPGVDLVLRLRFTHDLFDDDAVPAPVPPAPRQGHVGALIPTSRRLAPVLLP